MSATVPADAGYFEEKLASARSQVTRTWKQRSRNLKPSFPHTDIIGALFLARQEFDASTATNKVLVIFSDMRQSTPELGLDGRARMATFPQALARRESGPTDLSNVAVYVLGVDAAGMSIRYWEALRDSWAMYFKNARANLKSYSVLRERPGFFVGK